MPVLYVDSIAVAEVQKVFAHLLVNIISDSAERLTANTLQSEHKLTGRGSLAVPLKPS